MEYNEDMENKVAINDQDDKKYKRYVKDKVDKKDNEDI